MTACKRMFVIERKDSFPQWIGVSYREEKKAINMEYFTFLYIKKNNSYQIHRLAHIQVLLPLRIINNIQSVNRTHPHLNEACICFQLAMQNYIIIRKKDIQRKKKEHKKKVSKLFI